MRLIIGNRNYSSWSLRGWLVARKAGLDFDELLIPLDTPEGDRLMAEHCPAGCVPVLEDDGLSIWDSLAIAEYLAERQPALWPADRAARAVARSACAQMHSDFAALRDELPMNCRRAVAALDYSAACAADIARIEALWAGLRRRFGAAGPWLCGDWSVVDAFFAPVALRFDRYAVPVSAEARAYLDTQLGDADLAAWLAAARQERYVIEHEER